MVAFVCFDVLLDLEAISINNISPDTTLPPGGSAEKNTGEIREENCNGSLAKGC